MELSIVHGVGGGSAVADILQFIAAECAVEAVLYATVVVEFAATAVEFATAAVVLAKSATLATAYNCEPLIASVDVLPTNPAATF